jgi:hypothetical protein
MKPYKRKPGEFEIRILPDGRVLMPAPDEALLEVARILDGSGDKKSLAGKAKKNDRAKATRAKKRTR